MCWLGRSTSSCRSCDQISINLNALYHQQVVTSISFYLQFHRGEPAARLQSAYARAGFNPAGKKHRYSSGDLQFYTFCVFCPCVCLINKQGHILSQRLHVSVCHRAMMKWDYCANSPRLPGSDRFCWIFCSARSILQQIGGLKMQCGHWTGGEKQNRSEAIAFNR